MQAIFRLAAGVVAFSVFSVVYVGPVWGDVHIEPRLTLREEYDSNVFLDSSGDPEGDFISIIKPGVSLDLDTNLLQAKLDYSLDFRIYGKNSAEDQTSLRDAQRVLAEGTFFPERDFSIDLFDEYSSVVIDEQQPVSDNNPSINRTILNRFEIYPNYRLRRFKTWEFQVGYRFRDLNYDLDTANSSTSHRYDFNVFKKISEKFQLLGRYGYEQFDSSNSEDYTRNEYSIGFEYQLSSKLGIGAEWGEISLDFDERGEKSGPYGYVWSSYKVTPTVSSRLVYKRDYFNSVEYGSTYIEELALNVTQTRPLVTNELGLFARKQQYQEIDREDRSTGMRVNVTMPLSEKVDAGVNGYLTYFSFDEELLTEDVVRWSAGCSLAYRLRIGQLSGGYNYERSDSELDFNDYEVSRIFVQLAMTF